MYSNVLRPDQKEAIAIACKRAGRPNVLKRIWNDTLCSIELFVSILESKLKGLINANLKAVAVAKKAQQVEQQKPNEETKMNEQAPMLDRPLGFSLA